MSQIARAAKALLADIKHFSNLVIKRPLRTYQLEPTRAVIASVLQQKGLEFLIVFPRQAGKNEAVSQMLTYLLNIFQRTGGSIIYGAIGDTTVGIGVERLEEHLDNPWNIGQWYKKTKPQRRCLGKAEVTFLSSHPSAFVRGKTAHWLMVIDEAQDQVASHIEAVFTPMRAAYNATALYVGTVKLTTDFLWTKKLQLEIEERRDGQPRVFFVYPHQVTAENPNYKLFLDSQVRRHGRHHPIVASEYFLEPLDGTGGLFPPRRRRLMRGDHPRQSTPSPLGERAGVRGRLYVATLDVAGEDEAATDPIAALARPGRDYTVGHVFEVEFAAPGIYAPGPTYRTVDVFVDHGSKHFQESPGQPALIHRLHAWLESWNVAHLVADESGVGLGLVSWLKSAMGVGRVTGFNFAGTGKKASLGSAFLALVETHRFLYWTGDEDQVTSDGWWFWRQVEACTYEVPPEGQFDRHLRWEVPATHKTDTPTGPQLTHDDRLLSAALIAELDRLYRTGQIILGTAESAIVEAVDELADLGEVF